ncbi:exo-alpha-sialidase [Pasteurella canis]|uniref:exo-alpha-sialidase n=1 Tax=Pasteurella canis TaxID=753 RepID=UPI000D96624C|nr:exo-alpha-sialidase [Pasteurella canis]SPY33610.1 sialidase NanB [Pasteurella canis]
MKKFNPSLLTLALSSALLSSTFAFSQITDTDKLTLGAISHPEIKLFDKSLTEQGSENVPIWRIPSLLRTKDGVLIAAADKRWQHRGDWGDIDTAIRISHDDGKTWGNITTILDLTSRGEGIPKVTDNAWGMRRSCPTNGTCNSAFLIDAQMVQDKRNGRIFLAVDMFPESSGLSGVADNGVTEFGNGYVNIGGKSYLQLKHGNARYTLRENGEVFDQNNHKTDYKVIINGDPKQNYKDLGNVINSQGELLGNIYLKKEGKNAKVPFTAPHISYFWLTHSDDNGKTWSQPIDLTAQVKKDWMRFFGTGPGVGIQTQNGNLLFPIYYINRQGKQSAALIISRDGGKTWDLGQSPNDNRPDLYGQNSETLSRSNAGDELTESQLVELDNGDLKLFMRNTSGRVMMSTSKDGGYTWTDTQKVDALKHGYSQLSVIKYSKKINNKEYVVFSGQSVEGSGGDDKRRDGKLFLGEVQEDGSIVWKTNKLVREIQSSGKANRTHPNGYVYSSMAELGDGSIGLAYENTTDYTTIMYLPIEMQEFFWRDGKIFSDIRQKAPLTVTYNGVNSLEKIGDGIVIKQGVGESLGGVTVSEGTLVLAQKAEQDKNKAFTSVTLNKTGILQVEAVQNIDALTVNNESSGYIQFTVSDEKTSTLNIANVVSGKEVRLQVDLQKKLKPNDKGYYHAQGVELITFKDDGQVKWRLVDNELAYGMYVYTVASVAKPSVFRSPAIPHSLYLTNKLITADGKAVSTVAPVKAPSTVNARSQVNPVLASYLTANLAINKISEQLHQGFIHETRLLQDKDRSIFVKYLNGKQKYGSNLSFIDYGYDFNSSYNSMMLGAKVWHSERGNSVVYTALNKTSYKVTPKAVDGETRGKYQSWGGNINLHSNLPHNLMIDLSTGYQRHKGDIEYASRVKGHTFNIGADLGYRHQWMKNVSITPRAGLHYLYASLSDVNDQTNKALLKYNNFNALKAHFGVELSYRFNMLDAKGQLSYDMYKQKTRQLYVDNVAYKQGKLADTFNLGTQVVANITSKFALSTELGFQYARSKGQYSFAIGARYQF